MTGGATLHTDFAQSSGWYAVLAPPPPAKRLEGSQTADWVVVGAGFTGLAAARRLGELAPGARVILLETHRVGYGTSGRNSGFIIDTPHYTAEFGADYNRRVSRLVRAGRARLKQTVERHGIDCEWSERGHLHAIVGARRMSQLDASRRALDAVDETYEWLEGEALAAVLGTRHYHAAIRLPRTVLMNPAALCRGLAETMPPNVEVYEESPVRRVEPGAPVRIECPGGAISAKGALLTTNALTPALGYLRRELFPLAAYASLSRPLTGDERAVMTGESEWGLTPAAPMGPTIRRTRANRMLFRSVIRYTGDFRVRADLGRKLGALHRELLARRFPALAGLEMEHTWGGVMCMTWNKAPFFGRLEPGVFASLGYNGVGVPRGTISGALLAELAVGCESDLLHDAQALAGPTRLPVEPFLGLGVNARLAWLRLHAGAER